MQQSDRGRKDDKPDCEGETHGVMRVQVRHGRKKFGRGYGLGGSRRRSRAADPDASEENAGAPLP